MGVETLMIADPALRHFDRERQRHEVFGRDVGQLQPGIGPEAEAAVIIWFAKQDASLRAHSLQPVEPGPDECAADALALPVRTHSHGAKSIPAQGLVIDCDWREGDVSDQVIVVHRDERDRQGLGKRTFGLCDKQADPAKADIEAQVERLFMHEEKGIEDLILKNTTAAALERFADQLDWLRRTS
jgi:hypothetical protein